ncbi:hypothetical protein ABMA27_009502 [Loxostege sticticalis]|uniref:Uncharacterized protein n=1 Tax=Loxostege sticticalis TaxID=481309 RepID=A0ABR3H8D9_LOXSC
MLNLKACVACLSTNVKLFSLESEKLREHFNKLSGLQSSRNDGLPEFLCFECYGHVKRFVKFRDKCQRANFALKELLHQNKEIQKSTLEAIDRQCLGVEPSLSYLDLDKAYYEETKFIWVRNNRLSVKYNDEIPIFTYGTLSKDVMFGTSNGDVTNFKTDDNFKEEDEEADIIKALINTPANNESEVFYEQSTSNCNENNVQILDDIEADNYFDSDNDSIDNTIVNQSKKKGKAKKADKSKRVDGSNLDFEYAEIKPLSVMESKAACEISTLLHKGKYRCEICNKSYNNESRLKLHKRMHDKHISGTFECELCHYCYKTNFLLQTHMTEKHIYKYLCRKCPEVSFDRCTAKQHYIYAHMQNRKRNSSAYDQRPDWLNKRGGKRFKGSPIHSAPKKKVKKKPEDYPIYTPISHEEQYQMIVDRKLTKNYLESQYRCELCYKGFRGNATYSTHMKKHDPQRSGKLQCDMCKLYFRDRRKMYKHMQLTHLHKFSCQMCSFKCFSRSQAISHYKWHQNVIYPCPHCDKKFEKISTQLTHIRIKHPSTCVCILCGHSFVSETGLHNHLQIRHTAEEVEASKAVSVDKTHPCYCAECDVQFMTPTAFQIHLGSSNKHSATNKSILRGGIPGPDGEPRRRGRRPVQRPRRERSSWAESIHNNGMQTSTTCEVCGKYLPNDVQARRHYDTEHPGAEYLKRYMCDVCGHTTKQYANLMVHMRTHTRERPYECPHCERRFSMPSNRDRHLVVHTGEKRYQCQHCNRRFTQSSAVKLHIQTVHLKIPYAPWDKKNRKRRKELEGTSAPVSTVDAVSGAFAPQKLLMEAPSEFLNAYITYNDE